MAKTIGPNHGLESERKRLLALDPGRPTHNTVFGEPGKKYPEAPTTPAEGTLRKLVAGHNEIFADGGLADQLARIREDLRTRPF